MERMTVPEARSYINGFNRRHRQGWEQTRALIIPLVKALTGKTYEFDLPWLDEADEKESDIATPEQMAELRARAREMERLFNSKQNATD